MREVKGDSGGSGSIGIRTTEVEGQSELIQKCALLGSARIHRKVLERKANKRCVLASLGNLLLPGANEGTSFNIVSCVNSK